MTLINCSRSIWLHDRTQESYRPWRGIIVINGKRVDVDGASEAAVTDEINYHETLLIKEAVMIEERFDSDSPNPNPQPDHINMPVGDTLIQKAAEADLAEQNERNEKLVSDLSEGTLIQKSHTGYGYPTIKDRFRTHKLTPSGLHRCSMISNAFIGLADTIEKLVPPSAERELAITRLQESKMWANTAFAIHGGEADETT